MVMCHTVTRYGFGVQISVEKSAKLARNSRDFFTKNRPKTGQNRPKSPLNGHFGTDFNGKPRGKRGNFSDISPFFVTESAAIHTVPNPQTSERSNR